jgi:hypothetical protein
MWTDKTPKQIHRFKDDDDVEKERHEYQGPQGDGFIDFEYRTVDGVKQMRSKHTGPEKREDTNWKWVEVKESPLV